MVEDVDAKRPFTAAQHAYLKVKSWILSGDLSPGARIDQDEVAGRMELSRMPIRSALDKLSAEGLVIIHPHRGITVTPLSAEHLNDVYLVRCQLEGLAVRLAASIVTAEQIATLHGMVDRQEALESDIDTVLRENRAFHMYIYAIPKRSVLLRIIGGLWEQCERYRRIFARKPGMLSGSTREHRHLVELIASGKAEEAAQFVVAHNRKTQTVLLSSMNKESASELEG